MNLLAPGGALEAIKGKGRVAIVDHRSPLVSPITLLVMCAKAAGFEWWGAQKTAENGQRVTTAFLDTLYKHSDGGATRRVVWTLCADDRVDIGGVPVGLHALCAGLGYAPPQSPKREPLAPPRGAAEVIAEARRVLPLEGEMPFNERGRRLLAAAVETSHAEVRAWILDIIELYRGYCWKLATPPAHPPHPDYGYPLDRHLRYVSGKRKGDVRASLCFDERMEELKVLGLR
jgi:hypothetical protein